MDTLLEYKCPCCGGKIEFDSQAQKMKCPYCDTEFDTETLKSYDDVLKREQPDRMEWEQTDGNEWSEEEAGGMSVYVCKSCGGEIVCESTTAPLLVPTAEIPLLWPEGLRETLSPIM